MREVSVIGHFAFGLEYLDGQTIKTKILTNELCRKLGEDKIIEIDTHGGAIEILKAPFQALKALYCSNNVLMLPACNGLRMFARLLPLFKTFFKKRKLYYIVIGGWLSEFLEVNKGIAKKLKSFDGIYVETNTMKKLLENQGFNNIIVMPNFKELPILEPSELIYAKGEPFKLCTFSRVMKEKGIEDAIHAVEAVNEYYGRIIYTLDIYGQVDPNQIEWFDNLKSKFPTYIRYVGQVSFDKSVDILKNYFALLFPTYYDGEGFAGTLLDAFAAGVPIVASDWRYNSEIIKDGVTGILFQTRNIDMFKQKLIYIAKNRLIWDDMKKNCLNESLRYRPSNVVNLLIEKL